MMMWPASQMSKLLITILFIVLLYFVFMEILLYYRVKYYRINTYNINSTNLNTKPDYERSVWIPCDINPICEPTVKSLLVDHLNHLVFSPLCAIFDRVTHLSSDILIITPNIISFSHVLVAFIGAKCLTCKKLAYRRVGVLLFLLRMFLDDLDGHVARARKHIKGERSEVGTLGYYVDGICDTIGVIAMMIGVGVYLKNKPPRRSYKQYDSNKIPYHHLNEVTSENVDIEQDTGTQYKTKAPFSSILKVVLLYAGQMVVSSVAWNRYIDVFQDMLEKGSDFDILSKQELIFRSRIFYILTLFWRLLNVHSFLHILSLAIFCNQLWPFVSMVKYVGYLLLSFLICFSEFLIVKFNVIIEQNVDLNSFTYTL